MYCCKKCGSVIDLGFCETDCPRGCYDHDDDVLEDIEDNEDNDDDEIDDDQEIDDEDEI
jgi:hypothetical protein